MKKYSERGYKYDEHATPINLKNEKRLLLKMKPKIIKFFIEFC